MSLGFEVTYMTRPLVAVRRIVEVHFDTSSVWIHNASRRWETPLERTSRCYLLRVDLLVDTSGFSWQA